MKEKEKEKEREKEKEKEKEKWFQKLHKHKAPQFCAFNQSKRSSTFHLFGSSSATGVTLFYDRVFEFYAKLSPFFDPNGYWVGGDSGGGGGCCFFFFD